MNNGTNKIRNLMQFNSKKYLYSTKIVDSVKNILGTDFYGLEEFVKKEIFDFNEDKCTILVTRRCLLSVEWFIGYILRSNKKFECYLNDSDEENFCYPYIKFNNKRNYIISDKADLRLLDKGVQSISIIDDICIHGISLRQIADRVSGYFFDKKVETCVYMMSEETICVYPDKYYKVSLRADWKNLSVRFLEFINYMNLPYVSYLNSFTNKLQEDEFNKLIKILEQNYICLEINKEYNQLSKYSYLVLEREVSLKEHELMKCLRVYYNYNIKTLCIMPYVIIESINNLSEQEIELCFSNYINLDDDNRGLFFKNKELDFKYHLLSCIASLEYLKGFELVKDYIKNYENEIILDNIGCLSKSFGIQINNVIMNYWINDNGINVKQEDLQTKIINLNENEIKKYLVKVEKEINDICIKSWLDFERSSYDVNRTQEAGYESLEVIISKEIDNNCKYAYLLSILNYCDQGKMNITCRPQTGESLLKAGELGCLCVNKAIYAEEYKNKILPLLGYYYYRYLFI